MAVIRARADDLQAERHAPRTIEAYEGDWKHFAAWCESHAFATLPAAPETVRLYLSHLVPIRRISTVERRLAAILWKHHAAGFPGPGTPLVRSIISGARRKFGVPVRQKAALSVPELLKISESLASREGVRAARDRAVILLGFACASRRSDLAALNLADIDLRDDRVTVQIRRGKTDQTGKGRTLVIPCANEPRVCPVLALKAWLEVRGRWSGPLFPEVGLKRKGVVTRERMPGIRVYLILRMACKRAGLDPSRFGAHSLRSGAATAAADSGATVWEIMELTGHRTVENVAKYVRRATANYALRKAL